MQHRSIRFIDADTVHARLSMPELIQALHRQLALSHTSPPRQLHTLSANSHSQLAILPSWTDKYIAIKQFTYLPENKTTSRPTLHSLVNLFSRETGEPLAVIDGSSITLWRTAAVSGLASSLLSSTTSSNLVLFGTGHLAEFFIRAHTSVRELTSITCIGSSIHKTQQFIEQHAVNYPHIAFSVDSASPDVIEQADIISCISSAKTPLFDGHWLSENTYIDAVGNHFPDQREIDTTSVIRSQVFADDRANVLREAGELLLAEKAGAWNRSQLIADLSELIHQSAHTQPEALPIATNADNIRLFKSVGMGIADLITAGWVYENT